MIFFHADPKLILHITTKVSKKTQHIEIDIYGCRYLLGRLELRFSTWSTHTPRGT
jgi:hypothetical protein